MTSFHLIIAVAALLVTLGLIMVLSASGVHSYDEDGSPWMIFGRQVLWTAGRSDRVLYRAADAGADSCAASRSPVSPSPIVLLVLVLIPGIGKVANGSRGWFVVVGLSMQPSELAKIAFAIWGAHLLAARRMERASLREMLIPLVPAAVIALALIVAQPDLGQTVSLGIILLALLWYAGLPLRVFLSSLVAVVVSAAVLAMAEGYRSDRVHVVAGPRRRRPGFRLPGPAGQVRAGQRRRLRRRAGPGHGEVELPAQRAQRLHLRDHRRGARLRRCLGLLCLFGLFAYTGMRIARRSADPFLRLLTATATMWVIGQVFINVGYVIGLLPVTGLQLPLISAGGTSTATTLLMIGVMANAARHEPEAVAALRAGREDRVNRLLRLPLPEPYVPTRVEALRDRLRVPPGQAAKPARQAKPRPRAEATRQAGADRRKTPCGRPAGATLRASWRRLSARSQQRERTAPPGPTGSHIGRSALRVNGRRISRRFSPVAGQQATSNPRWRWPMR